jgi:hypothetical protein
MTRSAAAESWTLFWAARPDERADMARLLAEDPRPDIQAAVVRTLGDVRLGDSEISAWLREQAQDPDARVAQAAMRELSERVLIPPIPDVQRRQGRDSGISPATGQG